MASEVKTLSPSKEGPVKRKSPWGTPTQAPTPCSLAAVMDEELAMKLQHEEEHAFNQELMGMAKTPIMLADTKPEADTRDDLLLAQMLQLEFDREHDSMLTAEEKHYNKHSKVHVSFENFRSVPPFLRDDDSDDEQYRGEFYSGDEDPRPQITISRGHRRSKGVPAGAVTKHDPVVCGRKNVKNMEKFPPDFPAGDMNDETQDYRLPNAVFNTLKLHSQKEEKYAQRLHEKKEHSTQEQALDPKTKLMLFKLVDSGVLAEVNGCISTGKEACVYHATGGNPEDFSRTVPSECAIKVFKTTLNEFKNRDRYIKDDFRFKDVCRFGKQNPRKFIKLWAEKEMYNLNRLRRGGVPCPEVVLLRKHVLIMSFIGHDMKPAPKLKEITRTPSLMNTAYQQCIQGMKRMYTKCRLIHADLSEYNMLWHDGSIYFIDVSQAVEPSHPLGLEFLFRDCNNVYNFFSKTKLVDDVMTPQQLFNYVTGLGIHADSDQEFLIHLRNHRQREKLEAAIHSKTNYPFDYFFEQTTSHLCDKEEKGEQPTVSSSEPTQSIVGSGSQAGAVLGEGLADSTSSSDEDST